MSGLILAIDQGSSSTRAIAFDLDLRPVASASRPIATSHPAPGWVEQDPDQILDSVVAVVAEVLGSVDARDIAAVGLDNQGESVVAWDARSGRALAPCISWQCTRSEPIVARLRCAGHEPEVRRISGLPLDSYFSAGKMAWLIGGVPAVAEALERGTLRLGTVDAWLTDRLAGLALTDPSTASRTQLFDLDASAWSRPLADLFGVPVETLPAVVDTAGAHATLSHRSWGDARLPLTALACDQQAALAGHAAFEPGTVKATFGTGVFVLANAGPSMPQPDDRLLTTVAWRVGGATTYAVDGGVFSAGTLLEWLVELGVVGSSAATEEAARAVTDTGGVRVLPAFGGLGAPWWRRDARAVIAGLTLGVRPGHLARAALDAIAHRTADVVEPMLAGMSGPAIPAALRVDGGLTANAYLTGRVADLVGLPVEIASIADTTALGIAGLAGIGAGLTGPGTIAAANPPARRIASGLDPTRRARERADWRSFVEWTARPIDEGGDGREAEPADGD